MHSYQITMSLIWMHCAFWWNCVYQPKARKYKFIGWKIFCSIANLIASCTCRLKWNKFTHGLRGFCMKWKYFWNCLTYIDLKWYFSSQHIIIIINWKLIPHYWMRTHIYDIQVNHCDHYSSDMLVLFCNIDVSQYTHMKLWVFYAHYSSVQL